ncbi:MAG: hypothetical protein ABIG44_17020 [Planctomycetota bacterium]
MPEPDEKSGAPKRRSVFGSVLRHLGRVGREVVSVSVGDFLSRPETPCEQPDNTTGDGAPPVKLPNRVNVLHNVTEKLRGAADDYIAAKLDEMEARVDAKLNHIEDRLDAKLIELHQQLADMRDRELRHRLRLLKITLIFTVLVALLSLGYKWLSRMWS